MQPNQPLNIVLLGAGNVGTVLGHELQRLGHKIQQVYSRTLEHADVLAKELGSTSTNALSEITLLADLYILTVKDDAILEIAQSLRLPGRVVVHTSGSMPMSALSPISEKTGVVYPLQTFSRSREVNWKEIPFCLEASGPELYSFLQVFAQAISPKIIAIDSEQRRWLHLSAVWASNFLNHMLLQAKTIAEKNGLAFEFLKPLVLETVNKAFQIGPASAQTGPALRGDQVTLGRHTGMLADSGSGIVQQLYTLLSDSIAASAKELQTETPA